MSMEHVSANEVEVPMQEIPRATTILAFPFNVVFANPDGFWIGDVEMREEKVVGP